MMKKILFVVDERRLGGVSIVLENILKNIERKDYDITVLVLHNNGDRLNDLPEGIKVIYGNSYFDVIDLDFSSLLKNKKIFKAIKKIYISLLIKIGRIDRYIKKARKKMGLSMYDIEIAFKSGFCSLFVAYGDASKKLNWVHEDYKTYNKTKKYEKTFKKAFSAFDKHVIVSDEAAKSFNDIYNMSERSVIIENYIDISSLKEKIKEESNIKVDNNKFNIVTLGRFCYEKGFDRLIEAVKLLSERTELLNISKIMIYILGTGSEEILTNKINKYNLNEYIQVINTSKLNNNPYAFMKQCDTYIMSSRSESFGMVRIEALTIGLPVITTNVANTYKMVNEDIGIVTENSTEGIYNALKYALEHPEKISKLKENVKSYSYIDENKKIIEKIDKLLEEYCAD